MLREPFIIKVCGITSEQDAAVAIEAGANALGFNFYQGSPRYISYDRAAEISAALPGSWLRVGVFVNAREDDLRRALNQTPLNVFQLHGVAPRFRPTCGRKYWKAFPAGSKLPGHLFGFDACLLDTPTPLHGGSGKIFDWSVAALVPFRKIVAGGLDGDNVGEAIRIADPWGVDACSRLEEAPGRKSSVKVRQFASAARAAFARTAVGELAL